MIGRGEINPHSEIAAYLPPCISTGLKETCQSFFETSGDLELLPHRWLRNNRSISVNEHNLRWTPQTPYTAILPQAVALSDDDSKAQSNCDLRMN